MLERAVVYDTRDPLKKGRLRVRIPGKTGQHATGWIWPVVTSGYIVTPEPGDQVWIAYESGDEDFPVWLGRISVATTYKQGSRNLGNIAELLQRVSDLEDALANLQQSKADVSHSHP